MDKVEKAAPSDVEKNKTMAVLAYFIFFLPLLTAAKDSKFAKYHANQSLILLLLSVISSIIGNLVPVIGSAVSGIVSLAVFILWIIGLLGAAQGEMKPLPLVGPYVDQYKLIK